MNVYQIFNRKFNNKLLKSFSPSQTSYRDYLLPNIINNRYFHELSHLIQFKLKEVNKFNKGYMDFKGNYAFKDKYHNLPFLEYLALKRELETNAIHYRIGLCCNLLRSKCFKTRLLSLWKSTNDVKGNSLFLKSLKKYPKRIIKKRLQKLNLYFHSIYLEKNIKGNF